MIEQEAEVKDLWGPKGLRRITVTTKNGAEETYEADYVGPNQRMRIADCGDPNLRDALIQKGFVESGKQRFYAAHGTTSIGGHKVHDPDGECYVEIDDPDLKAILANQTVDDPAIVKGFHARPANISGRMTDSLEVLIAERRLSGSYGFALKPENRPESATERQARFANEEVGRDKAKQLSEAIRAFGS